MRILPFRRPSARHHPAPAPDWSQQELADFYRAHNLLAQHGVSIGLDRGRSEDGDPWMVFFDTASQDVFLHIARFDEKCVLVCDTLQINLSARTVTDLVIAFEGEVRRTLTVRQDRASSVLLHPAARIIMSISAVFLLFKLENSGTAQAKSLVADPAVLEAARKQDMSLAARVHQAVGRMLDLADSPAAAAAIAGAILTIELARNHVDPDAHQALRVAETGHTAEPALAFADLHEVDQALIVQATGDQPQPQQSAAPAIAIELAAIDLDARVEIALKGKAPQASQPSPAAEPAHAAPGADGDQAVQPQPDATAHRTGGTSGSGNASSATKAGTAGTDTQATATTDTVDTASLAAMAVKPLLDGDKGLPVGTTGSLLTMVIDTLAAATPTLTSAPVALGTVTAADIDALNDIVGLARETALVGDKLTSTIVSFMSKFVDYEVEIVSGRVLIEQHDTAALAASDVGIWTNVMSDGSEISVIGHVGVVQDVVGLG